MNIACWFFNKIELSNSNERSNLTESRRHNTIIELYCKLYTDPFFRGCLLSRCTHGQEICEWISKLELCLNIMKDDRNNWPSSLLEVLLASKLQLMKMQEKKSTPCYSNTSLVLLLTELLSLQCEIMLIMVSSLSRIMRNNKSWFQPQVKSGIFHAMSCFILWFVWPCAHYAIKKPKTKNHSENWHV